DSGMNNEKNGQSNAAECEKPGQKFHVPGSDGELACSIDIPLCRISVDISKAQTLYAGLAESGDDLRADQGAQLTDMVIIRHAGRDAVASGRMKIDLGDPGGKRVRNFLHGGLDHVAGFAEAEYLIVVYESCLVEPGFQDVDPGFQTQSGPAAGR